MSKKQPKNKRKTKTRGFVVPIITSKENTEFAGTAVTRRRRTPSFAPPTIRKPGRAHRLRTKPRKPRAGPILDTPVRRLPNLPPGVRPVPGGDPRFRDMVQIQVFDGTSHNARRSGTGHCGSTFFQAVADPDAERLKKPAIRGAIKTAAPPRDPYGILYFKNAEGGWGAPQLNPNPILKLPCIAVD